MKIATLVVAAALVTGACTTEVPGEPATPSSSDAASASPSPSSTDSVMPTEPDATISPTNPATPGTAMPGSVAALGEISPADLGVALVAVDRDTGTVSWFDGFAWRSFDVDAVLDGGTWATDGHGGLLVADARDNIWHLEPFTDEPTLVIDAPPEGITSRLVGGGVLDGRRHAYVEQGTHADPESASSDLLAFDLDGREDRTLLKDVAGWESGIGEVTLSGTTAVMSFFAECFGSVLARDTQTDDGFPIAAGEDCTPVLSTVGIGPFGAPAAIAVIGTHDETLPWSLVSRDLGEFRETFVSSLPRHDQDWVKVTAMDTRVLVSATGVAIVQDENNRQWRRLVLTVPGVVVVADDLPVG